MLTFAKYCRSTRADLIKYDRLKYADYKMHLTRFLKKQTKLRIDSCNAKHATQTKLFDGAQVHIVRKKPINNYRLKGFENNN